MCHSTLTVSTAIHTFAVTNQSFTVHSDTNSVTGSGLLTINRRALTVAAVDNIKTYDGGTTAAASPTVTGLVTGDTAGYTEAYTDKNFGVGTKTLVPSGSVSDGNSGNNYTIALNNFTTGTINKKAITVTAVTNTKTYDGNATAATLPNNSGVVGTDTAAFIEGLPRQDGCYRQDPHSLRHGVGRQQRPQLFVHLQQHCNGRDQQGRPHDLGRHS